MIDPYTSALRASASEVARSLLWAENQERTGRLAANGWTRLWIERMAAHMALQAAIKRAARKAVRQSLDHAQVETTALLLQSYLAARGITGVEVHAERMIKSIRPDVSVWLDGKPLAAIECKTQLGWGRNHIVSGFEEREGVLASAGFNRVWFLVATQCNWEQPPHLQWGDRWRVVSDEPVEHWGEATAIRDPIEPVFHAIAALAAPRVA